MEAATVSPILRQVESSKIENSEGVELILEGFGSIVIELYWECAPKACRNFVELSSRGYYDGVIFHRLVPGFILQGGDPTGTGRGGVSIYEEGAFEDEINGLLKHTGAGVVAMANTGPNSNRSQFYMTLAPCPWLDGKNTIFGRVNSGMRNLLKISLIPTEQDRPLEPVRIVGTRIVKL